MRVVAFLWSSLAFLPATTAFLSIAPWKHSGVAALVHQSRLRQAPQQHQRYAAAAEDDESSEEKFNPYADPNYPDLEFVNYDDPEYDSGVDEDGEYSYASTKNDDSTEEEIEAMREERRLRNDEFQFQTYWSTILKSGASQFNGEWTQYRTTTFFADNDDGAKSDDVVALPKLAIADPITVTSCGFKDDNDSAGLEQKDANMYSAGERIRHQEKFSSPMGDADVDAFGGNDEQSNPLLTYWPDSLEPFDFRGEKGIMVCGNAWTICTADPIDEKQALNQGPFSSYRSEIGIQADDVRFRIKFEYSILPKDSSSIVPPPLHLKTMTVCREALDKWPRSDAKASECLFGDPGAPGGLYDPPPVDDSSKYMLVDLNGGASVLFPAIMDQDESSSSSANSLGWVTSLDWTAKEMRYQIDRKVLSGPNLMGLRTLELSEVQGADADLYRPRDGGADMRQ